MDKVEIAKETLQNYIDKRYSQTQIAVQTWDCKGTVFKKMKEYGLKTKTKQSTYDKQVVIKMLQNGCTSKQIAEYFGTCSETVTNWIRKYGLGKYRKEKEPQKVFDTKKCRTCIYGTRKELAKVYKCDYYSKTGHSRNMGQPEAECSKYVKGKRKR